jgi:tetratricopeptide (TPR) repeat protein
MEVHKRHHLTIQFSLLLIICLFAFLFVTTGQRIREHFLANIELVTWTHTLLANSQTVDFQSLRAQRNFPPRGFTPKLLLLLNPKQQTETDFEEIASQDHTGAQALSLATFFETLGQQERANQWWSYLEQQDLCTLSLWYFRGTTAENAGELEGAIANYEKSSNTPLTPCDHYGRSDALFRLGRIWQLQFQPPEQEKAIAAYRKAVEIDDFKDGMQRAENHYQLGVLLFNLGPEYDEEALHVLETALELRPNHTWTLLTLGRTIYRMSGDVALAEPYLLRANEQNSSRNWRIPFQSGRLYASAGQVEDAKKYYLLALEMAPNEPRITSALDELTMAK